MIAAYNGDATSAAFRNFDAWPMDNTPALADVMIGMSEEITKMHKDKKALITDHLSSLVLEGAKPADVPWRRRTDRPGPVAQPRHHRPSAQRPASGLSPAAPARQRADRG
ncbi:hypothetical protein LP420_34450 [Massilia sp. B-10]|nr:hypothetical protein LP420_34450 [Massilia sp. B-10]